LGPLAVVLLAWQAVGFPAGSTPYKLMAVSLILGELAVLLTALSIVLLNIGRAHDQWITARLRAEILRREGALFRAGVGPYLNLTPPMAVARLEVRLIALEGELHDPLDLLATRDTHGSWRDALEDAPAVSGPDSSTLLGYAREYLQTRVTTQREWFTVNSRQHERRSEWLERGAKIVLTLATILAALHLGLLLRHPVSEASRDPDANPISEVRRGGPSLDTFEKVLLIVAIWLPALGSGFIAYQSALGSVHLARSYAYYAGAMEPLEESLVDLVERFGTSASAEDQRRLKRCVLAVEELLSNELRQWWMIMAVKKPTLSV
jgi:hypothetical protein